MTKRQIQKIEAKTEEPGLQNKATTRKSVTYIVLDRFFIWETQNPKAKTSS